MLCVGVVLDRFYAIGVWTAALIAFATIAIPSMPFLRLWRIHPHPLIIALVPLLPAQLGLQLFFLIGTLRLRPDPGWIAAALSVAGLLFEIPFLANRHLRESA